MNQGIGAASWRRRDCRPLDPATGNVGAAATTLSATDAGSVTVLHLDAGGCTDRHAVPFGQLIVAVAGSGVAEVGDRAVSVATGDAVRWPRDVPHRLRTDEGLSVVVVTYAEDQRAWRVSQVDANGHRWVVGVFGDTDRARAYRDRLRGELPAGHDVILE